ncbi:Aste57867_20873 [Aphanomyces stellatus]|uniref:Aste57867_20873 protein n=1 Tax=Aphanomyces stellatus TaxID=120398 RepID=A0A485LG04_9STRA|nr:hypothetical protein As57867_020805 [Aphanomyces stellatus]VFT97550.1 Aste57867_20873 [Aphanomyces stellatus]
MTESDIMREKLEQWRERERERGNKLRERLALIRAQNPAHEVKLKPWSPTKTTQEKSPTTSSSQNSSDDKENRENGSDEQPSKKRRLTSRLPIRIVKETSPNGTNHTNDEVSSQIPAQEVGEAASSRCEANLDGSLQQHITYAARNAQLVERIRSLTTQHEISTHALSARNEQLQKQVEVLRRDHEEYMADMTKRNTHLEQQLQAQAKRHDQHVASLKELHETSLREVTGKLQVVSEKYARLKEVSDAVCGDAAGHDIMPMFETFEEQVFAKEDEEVCLETLAEVKKMMRRYTMWVKSQADDKNELLFSNQVYLQHINQLQQKVTASQKEIASLKETIEDNEKEAAEARQELLDEVEQMNNTVMPALEKAMKQNKQLRQELAAATHTT